MGQDPERLAARLAAFAAPHGPGAPDTVVVWEDEWPALRPLLGFQRLTGLALAAIAAGALRLPSSSAEELEESHRRAMEWALAVERASLRICAALADAGVDVIVLKGPAFAHRFYPDPSWRPFGDLDLLVRTSHLTRAGAVLEQLDIRRTLPEPREGFDRRFGTGAVYRTPEAIEIDLHRTLVKGPFGLWMNPDELFDTTEEFSLGGRSLRRLDDTASLLHACIHAALGSLPPLLMPLRDVAQIAGSSALDWERLGEWAGRWRLGAVIAHAFGAAADVLGVQTPPPAVALARRRAPRRERRALLAYTTDRQRRGARALSTMRAIPGIRGRAAYAMALAVPSRRFLAARQGDGRGSYLRRWAIPLRWLMRRP